MYILRLILINTYFDHTDIIKYDVLRIKIPWLAQFRSRDKFKMATSLEFFGDVKSHIIRYW